MAWVDNSTNEALFRLQRCMGEGCSAFATLTAVVSSSSARTGRSYSWSNTGLVTRTVCSYELLACSAGGAVCSAPSRVLSATAA